MIIRRIYPPFMLALIILGLSGCFRGDRPNEVSGFRAEFVLEFEGETISITEENPTPFASTSNSILRLYGDPDSVRIGIIIGLGSLPDLDLPQINTLYVFFTRRFIGYRILYSQFRSWVATGEHPYVRDGEEEEGVGILWFDERGNMWASGKYIGERSRTGESAIPKATFSDKAHFQKEAKFTIVSSEAILPKPGYDFAQKVKLEFNCKLYNEQGDSLILNKGTFETALNLYNGG